MALQIPDRFIVPTVDALRTVFTKRWRARMLQADPSAVVDVGPKSLPDVAARVVGDVVYPLFGNVVAAAGAFLVRNLRGEPLLLYAAEKGIDGLRPATGATGYVMPRSIATGGAFVPAETVLVHRATSLRFRTRVADTYVEGQPIAIEGIDTGPATNLDAGTVLEFDSAPSGVSALVDVQEQSDGFGQIVGLTGGSEAETEEQLQDRIIEGQANPRADNNGSVIIFETERTPGVPVEKAWVVPAWCGPGSVCVLFTVRPPSLGASRIPTSVQRGIVEANLRVLFHADYSITVGALLDHPITVMAGVTWNGSTPGWVDTVPWPPSAEADSVTVVGAPAPSNTSARVLAGVAVTNPQVGQTFAVYDPTTRVFKKKRIASIITIISGEMWDLTFDFTNNASDIYSLREGQFLSPYSPSLNLLPAQVLTYFQGLGPGEQTAVLPDPGGRQRRFPFSPESWSSVVSNEGLVAAFKATKALRDIEVQLPATPFPTPVGVLGVSAKLLRVGDIAVFPQT